MFGAEFVAMKIGMELLSVLRYKLGIVGVEIYGTSFIYINNMPVIHNTHCPESTLNKNSNSIFYHVIRDSVVMVESITAHIGNNENIAYLSTKVLYGWKRNHMVRNIFYDIYDDEH